jgi:hypothetical protein
MFIELLHKHIITRYSIDSIKTYKELTKFIFKKIIKDNYKKYTLFTIINNKHYIPSMKDIVFSKNHYMKYQYIDNDANKVKHCFRILIEIKN